jgi:uncharacterized OsmC-like protein
VSALEAERVNDQPVGQSNGAAPGVREALFVVPNRQGDGFRASIRGHLLDLAEPSPGHGLAPTPDDLLIASIASDLAWSARYFLRAHGAPEDVSVSAAWRTLKTPSRLADIRITVSVPDSVETESDALMAALEERVAARSLDEPLRFDLRFRA